MRVIVVRVGQKPVLEEIGTGLNAMQKVVGGMIEVVPLDDQAMLVCNENGIAEKLPLNRLMAATGKDLGSFDFHVELKNPQYPNETFAGAGELGFHRIHGDFFLCREGEDGELTSVTDADMVGLVR